MPELQQDNSECTTCGKNLAAAESFATFPCPECSDSMISRCGACRKRKNKFECGNCGYRGP